MNIADWLDKRTVWEHGKPPQDDAAGMAEFVKSLKEESTRELASFSKGKYVSAQMMGSGARPASLRALGYYLTEHVLSHSNWRGGSRLTDLVTWGVGGGKKADGSTYPGKKSVVRLYNNKPFDQPSPDDPSQFEWLLWQTKCVMLDTHDPKIARKDKLESLGLLKMEVERVSGIWSQFKGQSKSPGKTTGDEVLNPLDRKAKNETVGLLNNIFGVMGVPSVDWFMPEYNPERFAPSVQANVEFDESYQKPDRAVSDDPQRDSFFDDEEEEEEPVRDLTQNQRMLLDRCHEVFFLFEQGYQIVATMRNAKVERGLRTVDPGRPLQLPEDVALRNSLPSELAYVRSVSGLKSPHTGKAEKSYIYSKVVDGKVLPGPENEIVLSAKAHREVRAATAPVLKLPEEVKSAEGARYDSAARIGMPPNQKLVYRYTTVDGKRLDLDEATHKKVIDLNPEHVSMNVRGGVDHLFNDFFVDKVKPHYRDYLPQSREERLIIRDRVKGELQDDVRTTWEEINQKGGTLEERTELTQQRYRGWLHKYMPPELEARVPEALREMKQQNEEAIEELVARKAGEKALVLYMEKTRGENSAANYGKYGLTGKYKTWASQLREEGGTKILDEHMSKAQDWAEREYGSLNKLVPETHQVSALLNHFQREVTGELEGALKKRGIDMPKDLKGLAKEVNPISISIFYDRRIKHLGWGYHLDKELPSLNLSRLAVERNAQRMRSEPDQSVAVDR